MSTLTLRLNPAVAAARKAARAAQPINPPPIVQQRATAQAVEALPEQPSKKAAKKQALDALEQKLRRVWPHVFDRKCIKPLAIGIRFDIAPHLSPEEAKLLPGCLARWCARKGYLRSLAAGAVRFGLDGQPAGEITDAQREHAMALLDGRRSALLNSGEVTA